MTSKQKENHNRMIDTLKKIGLKYQTPAQLRKSAEKQYGLSFKDALEMSYENIQEEAKDSIRGLKKI